MQTLDELCDHYLSVNTRIRDQRTRDHYRRSLRQFAHYLGCIATTDHLTDDNLAGFMLWTVDGGLVEQTANQRAKQIRALWDWAARRRMVEMFPTVKPLREPEPMPVAWKSHELPILFAACEAQRGYIGPHRASTWWSAMHWWEWDTGERAGATFNLRREFIDLQSRTASIPGRMRKGGRKAMIYRLRERTCELFAEMMKAPTDTGLVFDRNWKDEQSFYSRYRKLIADAGLPWVARKTGLQKMRITVFTMIEANGGNATAFAKHSSRRVTESYIDGTIIAACQKGAWPTDDVRPDKPQGWLKRLFRAGA